MASRSDFKLNTILKSGRFCTHALRPPTSLPCSNNQRHLFKPIQQVRNKITMPPDATAPRRDPARPFTHEVAEVNKRDAPVKFTGSGADKHKVLLELSDHVDDAHPYERFAIAGSIAALLIYFCILREENHLDREMRKPLWERIPGLEERTLMGLIEYHRERGEPTEKYEQRLKEVRAGVTDAKMAW